ncbi:tetratricopeptide repeat protein [Azospirillum brasilense]|uniref:Uncharacterized protein n=1 Tax=Azospirillum brasilense TaxID=192 RepID=A0A6L3ASH7_AZOBR|nr:tetratricopeptide repeat protein [Azospirillum brasilense]KAA0677912.1 hypothetical protein DS837_28735 [Azospirillum brasilense]
MKSEDIEAWRKRIREDTFSNYHYAMGIGLEREGSFPSAVQAYERAVAIDPNRVEATYRLISLFARLGRSDEARVFQERARAVNPNFPALALARIGREHLNRLETDEAKAALDEARRLDPDIDIARDIITLTTVLATKAWQDGRTADALALDAEFTARLARLTALPEDDALDLIWAEASLGYLAWTQGEHKAALSHYRRLLLLHPSRAVAYFYLAEEHQRTEHIRPAITAYERAYTLDPTMISALRQSGFLRMITLDIEMSVQRLQEAARIEASQGWAEAQLGLALIAAGRPEEARASTAAALQEQRSWAGHHALAELVAGRPEDAVRICREALPGDPESAWLHTNLGLALAVLGRVDEAASAHRRAMALQPANVWPMVNLMLAFRQKGDRTQAERLCRRVVDHMPDQLAIHHRLRPRTPQTDADAAFRDLASRPIA